ncbi:hypothetical protein BOW52_09155 [Solemya elarraichensis gill symbiont]|uniref:BatD protein n=1 Tax=Solemya elarraichensis gill symbiont TaxID=1918949 RepID=A0A1T2KZE4_9GAMM|nr:hypothetical protein BOW52_09155 [Solemya elarraichensis gill symbiont]
MSSDQYLLLQTTAPVEKNGQLDLLDVKKSVAEDASKTRYTIGWAYYPARAGEHRIEFPSIQLTSGGSKTHRFYLPVKSISVKPLPVYIPSNMPVGKLDIEMKPVPVFFITNRLEYIGAQLKTHGVLSELVPKIENNLQSQTNLQVYPAAIQMTRSDGTGRTGNLVDINVPIKAKTTGIYQLDDIEIKYFEPTSGKIETLTYQWPKMLFISTWLIVLLSVIFLLLVVYLLKYSFKYLSAKRSRSRQLKAVRNSLVSARTVQELKKGLDLLAELELGKRNASLKSWHDKNDLEYEPLGKALYNASSEDIDSIKTLYLVHINRTHRLYRALKWNSSGL